MRIFTALAVGIPDIGTEYQAGNRAPFVSFTAAFAALADSVDSAASAVSAVYGRRRSNAFDRKDKGYSHIRQYGNTGSAKIYDAKGQEPQEYGQTGNAAFSVDRPGDDPDQPEEALILRIGQGDRSAFEQLYETTSNAVYVYAFSLLTDREDAEDVMQETFLKIHAAAHLYRPQGKPMAWIMTIARNLCMSRFRGKKNQTELMPAHMKGETGLSQIRQAEDRMVLEAAMDVLSQEELRIIVLHGVSGVKHREISEIMRIPLSTVLSRYHRGLKKLRKRLEDTEV